MKNKEIAEIFYDIADILEMKGVSFKPQAYRRAAMAIENLSEDIAEIVKKGQVKEVPGVGESIAKKIEEFLKTGRIKNYEDLKKGLPKHIFELMEVPGLGPKRIKLLHEKLKISSLKDLDRAVKTHKISKLATFGAKSEEDIRKGLELVKRGQERILLGNAIPIALEIEKRLKVLKEVKSIERAGSLRRRKETVGDHDILVTSDKPDEIMDFFTKMKDVERVYAKGPTKSSVLLKSGLQVDLRVVAPESFGAALQYFTGNKEHNIVLRDMAKKKGWRLNEYGLFDMKKNKQIAGKTEEDIYEALHLKIMPPEMRENTGEIEAAMKGKIPKLISYGSLRGDFHTHTRHTDGNNTVLEMVEAAKKLGYEYIVISDHSPSERIANGNTPEEMLAEIKEIRQVDKKVKGIKAFAGSEVDILPNGSLDFDDEILKKLDIVVASVHSRFKSSKVEMTKRICTALENNKYVDILGHPTGRLIHKREPYDVDLKKVFRTAVENKVLLEINSQPSRLDIKDVFIKGAKELGAMFAIDSDAHHTSSLGFVELGIAMARRGWLEQKHVVNTLPLKQLPKFFKRLRL